MISIGALATGTPPTGLGIYDPRRRRDGQGWGFLAVNPEHARAGDWLFVGPEPSTPDEYLDIAPTSVDGDPVGAIKRLSDGIGPLTPGVIFDPEMGWPQVPASERAARFEEMARALFALALRTRVVITSHGGFPVERIPRWVRPFLSGSPQLYYDAPTNARVLARWRSVFGARVVPSVAGPRGIARPPADWSTDAGYSRYLDSIPRDVPGAIVWDLTTIRASALAAIRARWGGLGAVLPSVAAFVTAASGMLALAMVALIAIVMVTRGMA